MYPTTLNTQFRILASPTDPKWQSDYTAFQARKAARKAEFGPSYNSDNDLCSIQCRHEAQGFSVACIWKTIRGYRCRTMHSGGIPLGQLFETRAQANDWLVNTWYAAAPDRREVIEYPNVD